MHLPSPSFNFYRTQTFYILWVLHMSRQLSNHSAVLCRVLLTVYISHDTDPLTSNPERGCLIICAAGIVVISPKTCKQAQCFFLGGGGRGRVKLFRDVCPWNQVQNTDLALANIGLDPLNHHNNKQQKLNFYLEKSTRNQKA